VEAVESVLAQTLESVAVVALDDCSTDSSFDVLRRYAGFDDRLTCERSGTRLGLVRAFRETFDLASMRFPGLVYFAWASDHDVWHPMWAEHLVAELEAHPEAVLAYPFAVPISEHGADLGRGPRLFDTAGVRDPSARLRLAARWMKAGDLIYGLYRADALRRAGPKPLVLIPDRLLLSRLALEGEFRQVPRRLWYRRYRTGVHATHARQRRSLFPGRASFTTHVPWPLVHAVLMHRSLRRSLGRSRTEATALAMAYLRAATGAALELETRNARRRRRLRRRLQRLKRSVRAILPEPLVHAIGPARRKLDRSRRAPS
jgi:glycosyltransferase involved in cell wall biosynthesis